MSGNLTAVVLSICFSKIHIVSARYDLLFRQWFLIATEAQAWHDACVPPAMHNNALIRLSKRRVFSAPSFQL
jgi:hypothetical protein